ncbi:glucose-1-phosphate adenylyltransferase [Rhodopirellula maiorica SM1]|uniref:Glucose-1-phosphate adenylyltransferase n=2 Tax=Novipirellula TaxID=2795426 RepID=M5RXS4_9BACT|nr:glucose-1-phosphate adenylyltransferase [Rhodopirellula maiorica SM1]
MDPAWIDARGVESHGRDCLASMGLYIFNKSVMVDLLNTSSHEDFGKGIFPQSLQSHKVQVHLFDGYWEDIGTIRAFYEANLSLAGKAPPFELRDPNAPIYSRPRFLPPTIMGDAHIESSLIADGCRIGDNVTIKNSVIGLRTVIGDNVTIKDSVVMGADDIECEKTELPAGVLPMGIGNGSVIEGTILDKNCRIGENVKITNQAGVEHQGEDEALQIRDGISIVIKEGQIESGHQS